MFMYSLSMGGKKTSLFWPDFIQLYSGMGFPELDLQLRVTFPFSFGFPDREHLGTAGGTEARGLQNVYFVRLFNIIDEVKVLM